MPDLHVGLLYGGQSAEHDVSVLSARNVRAALGDRYRVTSIYITRDGRWLVGDSSRLGDGSEGATRASFVPHADAATVRADALGALGLDVVFPVLHGHNGEDGTVQGFLHVLGLPYVGPGVLASAACMDKAVAKRLFDAAGLPNTPYAVVHAHARGEADYADLRQRLGDVLFVKPANSGSSVGVTKVTSAEAFPGALDEAFRYDKTALVERANVGREIEVAVLGDAAPEASAPGEIVLTADYYDYDAKYTDEDASRMEVPADLPEATVERVRQLAVEAYAALGCEGMARVDFFVLDSGEVLLNEINTIPGFTARSMYPVMWEESGRPFPDVVDRLIELALARHERQRGRKTTR